MVYILNKHSVANIIIYLVKYCVTLLSIIIPRYYAYTCNNAVLTALIAVAAAEVAEEDTPTEVTGDTPTTEACPGLLASGECMSANSGTDVTER